MTQQQLDLERIFSDPDINGKAPLSLKFSPDGSKITYLKSAEENFEQLDLWQYDIATETTTCLVNSSDFIDQDRVLSDTEKARRERLRISHQGIVEYHWAPNGLQLIFPINGNLYIYELGDISTKPVRQLTFDDTFETDFRFSPDSQYLAFVRAQNLFTIHLASETVKQLTTDGGGNISNGLAEFIAQEEMHRFSGYWWSPDSCHIAFTQVDETPIEVSHRIEIDANSFGVFEQRYPFAGDNNAAVKLGLIKITTNSSDSLVTWLDVGLSGDLYLGRVNWLQDSDHLALQVQSRNQQRLDLSFYQLSTSTKQLVLTETSETWLNLNDCFYSLTDNTFIWASERSGFQHLYHYRNNGELIKQLTSGDWVVSNIRSVTPNKVLFQGFADTVLESHLYQVDLDDSTQQPELKRLTSLGASHQTEVSGNQSHYIDRHSSALVPPRVDLQQIQSDGSSKLALCIEANALDETHAFYPFKDARGKVIFGELEAPDGQTLHYRLIEPSNRIAGKAYPVIVTVYGGPGVQRVSNEWLPAWNHYMASQGYGLLQLDNRGSSNRGVKFEAPIYKQLGVAEVADQLRGVEFLQQLNWVDPKKIGVFGHSYGGYMTLMLMMKSKQFCAGISVAPVTEWGLYDTHYTERFLAHPEENNSGYTASNVFPYVKDLHGELMVIHGMADDNVLFTNSTKLFKALQDENILFESMNYPGAKHGLSGRRTNLHRYATMDKFFAKNLKD